MTPAPGGLRGTGRQAKRSLVFQVFIRHLLCQAAFDSRPRPAVPQAPGLPDPARHPATIGLNLPSPQTPAPAPSRWEWNPEYSGDTLFSLPSFLPGLVAPSFLQIPRPTPASGLDLIARPLFCSSFPSVYFHLPKPWLPIHGFKVSLPCEVGPWMVCSSCAAWQAEGPREMFVE